MLLNKPLFLCFFILLLSGNTLNAEELSPNELNEKREIYIRAEHALKKNDYKNYDRLVKRLEDYPLYPYIIYESIKQDIHHNTSSLNQLNKIEDFEKKYPDFPFTIQLRHAWLKNVGKSKKWDWFIKGYQTTTNEELQCYYLHANYQIKLDPSYLEQAKILWLVGYSQPDSCNALFAIMDKKQGISKELVWEKIKLALESKNFTLTKSLHRYLTKEERLFLEQWEKMIKSPHLLLNKLHLNNLIASEENKAEALYQSLRLLARRDAGKALNWLKTYQTNYHFSKSQLEQLHRDIGMYLSHQRNPLAKFYLAELPAHILDNPTLEWRIRLALSIKDWKEALLWIEQLPPELKEEKSWIYWQARAKEALHQPGSSTIYQQLAKTRSYYGFLSSFRLKQSISLQNHPIKTDNTLTTSIRQIPAIQRFIELNHLGKTSFARVEWFRAVDKMDEQQLIIAAKLAQSMSLYDIAILTIAKSQNYKDDLELRFPLCYQQEIMNNAHQHNLDPAWIFAITRQESAFFNEAISKAGARGLMQLMPSTAQFLASSNNIVYSSEHTLHQPEINIQLGSVYLKNLKSKMNNHLILATASYNAGPENIYRWLPNESLDADIWIETIPFKETREYVKNVLVFMNIYRQKLGYSTGLGWVLKPIPPKSVKSVE